MRSYGETSEEIASIFIWVVFLGSSRGKTFNDGVKTYSWPLEMLMVEIICLNILASGYLFSNIRATMLARLSVATRKQTMVIPRMGIRRVLTRIAPIQAPTRSAE